MNEPAATVRTGSTARFASRYFRALRIPVTLACLLAAILAGYYFFYVTRNTSYLVGRNLRLLGNIGRELQDLIDNNRTVLGGVLKDKSTEDFYFKAGDYPRFPKPEAFESIPVLRSVHSVRPARTRDAPLSLRFTERTADVFWSPRGVQASTGKGFEATVDLQALVEPLLSGESQTDVFDSLALTTARGRVLFQVGDPSVSVADVSKLLRSSRAKEPTALGTEALTHSGGVFEVVVAGSDYTLLVRPCCEQMVAFSSTSAFDQTLSDESGWLICAFVPRSRLSAAGAAIPFGAVGAIAALLLLAIFSWPFLKFLLIGELQRIGVWDVLLVGVCALLGVSFVTLFALDRYAVTSLTDSLDDQLVTLADTIRRHAKWELDQTFQRLDDLDKALRIRRNSSDRRDSGSAPCQADTVQNDSSTWTAEHDVSLGATPPAGPFESFARIDADGCQVFKRAFGQRVTPLVSVKSREYFTHWQEALQGERLFVEPVRSLTSGKRQVVVSKRAAGVDANGAVVAITVPLRSLLDPVLIEGFGFVVIDENGRVLFHSDPEHNLSENFFTETDQSRRLRALVAARHSELLNVNYWADPHRAFVTPLDREFGWSLVTFYDRPMIDTINVEWFVTAATFTLIYCSVFVLIGIGTVVLRPAYRAPWAWPDQANAHEYLTLLSSYVLLAVGWIVVLPALEIHERLRIAWLIPLLTVMLTFVVLAVPRANRRIFLTTATVIVVGLWLLLVRAVFAPQRIGSFVMIGLSALACGPHLVRLWRSSQRSGPGMAPPLNLTYGLASGMLLVLVAVLPPATFLTVGHGIHVGNLLRYGQLRFGLDLAERERLVRGGGVQAATVERLTPCRSLEGQPAQLEPASCDPGIYGEFFYCTRRAGDASACETAPARLADVGGGQDRVAKATTVTVPEILEGILPYYSESAVKIRELMHDRPDHDSWRWHQTGRELTFAMLPPGQGSPTLFASAVPSLMGDVPPSARRWVVLILAPFAIGAVVVWTVRFGVQRIFVLDLTMPLWAGLAGSVPSMSGPTLFLLSREDRPALREAPTYFHVNFSDVPRDGGAQAGWFQQRLEELAQGSPGESVVISHFEDRMHDRAFNDRKLAFIEELVRELNRTVMVVSSVPPQVFLGAGTQVSETPAGPTAAGSRWAALLSECSLTPAMPPQGARSFADQVRPTLDWRRASVGEFLWRTNTLRFSYSARFLEDEQRDPFVKRVWMQILPYAWQAERRAPLDLEQLLVEVGERLENYYRGVLASCTASERVVLTHVAEDGLVNHKDSRTVRVLLARGLLQRQPHFRVMNETFRRFVLSTSTSREVKALEQRVSTWDSVRWPFLIVFGTIVAVFFATQQELFNQTVGLVGAVAAGLPALVQVIGLLSGTKRGA